MTSYGELWAALAAPFHASEEKHRRQGGRDLTYVTARTVMNRLDAVLGPENWWDRYTPGENSALCELTVRLPDGSILTKVDCGGNAGMSAEGDDDKGAVSDAFKRAAVKFGVGRYLYGDGVPEYRGAAHAAPAPREEAPRRKERSTWGTAVPRADEAARPAAGDDDAPRTGKALYARLKDLDERHDYGVFRHVDDWAKARNNRDRMYEWDRRTVADAWAEAGRFLEALAESDRLQHA